MKTAICAIIKDENEYLDEWLDYHLNLGIDEIYLYEDYGSLSHSTITEKYGNSVHLDSIDVIFKTFKENREYNQNCSVIQEKLFDWFPVSYQEEIEWVLFIDVDEFLILKQPLQDFLNEYKNESAIWIKWKFYNANGYIKKPEGKVMKTFTRSCATSFDFGWNCKSFVNLKKYTKWITPIHKVSGGKYPLTNYGDNKAYINHYFTKSWEEWKYKLLLRGDTYPGNRKIAQFFLLNPDLLNKKNELLLEIAIENATKLGFNKNWKKEQSINNKKLLHFCWFGKNQFTEIHKNCIDSWRKYLSDDFLVCFWNESSFDYNDIEFTKNAYENKSWAYVSDYARLWAIYTYGGIYLDTDVELLKPIDNLPDNFLAIEKDYDTIALGLGFGASKGNKVIGDILYIYNNLKFDINDLYNNTINKHTMNYFNSKNYVLKNNEIHNFLGFTIYPVNYFCPKSNVEKNIILTEETMSIHHYIGSWAN